MFSDPMIKMLLLLVVFLSDDCSGALSLVQIDGWVAHQLTSAGEGHQSEGTTDDADDRISLVRKERKTEQRMKRKKKVSKVGS